MKICPVCNARCFDDMEVCYGCLHRFAQELGSEALEMMGDQAPLTEPKPEGFPVVFGRSEEVKEREFSQADGAEKVATASGGEAPSARTGVEQPRQSVMTVPAVTVCGAAFGGRPDQNDLPAQQGEGEGREDCEAEVDRLVLRIEMPRHVRGISIAYE